MSILNVTDRERELAAERDFAVNAMERMQAERDALSVQISTLVDLLDETRRQFTRDDDLPDNLLPRIDAAMVCGVNAALEPQEPKVCRPDGRCQYAIDSGAEGLGHCPVGKCCMPDVEQTTHATNDEWLANCPQSVRDFAAKISKETKALVTSVGETAQDPFKWQPIETAPKDNKRPLLIARFNEDGTLQTIDHNASYEQERESWEIPELYWLWMSENGNVEDPTHWMYQPDWYVNNKAETK